MVKPKNTTEFNIPPEVSRVTSELKKAGYEAYIVGGCVRDLLLGKKPKDWDVTTNATPEQIIGLFKDTFYENDYGTVGVVNEDVSHETLKVIEVTPYRIESGYSDNRRPDSVTFSTNLKDDLKRRDFTINALAYDPDTAELVDLYNGQKDLQNKLIRAVGNPDERFKEDGLRILRAIRLQAELGFEIEPETQKALSENAALLKNIAVERIREEFNRILLSADPSEALRLCQKTAVLSHIMPELEEGIGIDQNKAHAFDVWNHLMKTVQHAAKKKFSLPVRLAALLHDIAKPATRRWSPEKKEWTFYGHDVVGERTVLKILKRLKYPKDLIDQVTKLVRWHMFFSDTEKITLSAVRRLIANVGQENIWELMNVRTADRIGTGRPKESPYRLRKYHSMVEEAMHDPISVSMLKISGGGVIETTGLTPGPKIGFILHALLEEVLDDPKKNTTDYLEKRSMELSKLADKELESLGKEAREKKEQEQEKVVHEIRKRHWVE